ncbi:MAG: phosphoheptose isomerase [Planctomycetes bacterium RBG_13_63_9]|nr:MAG: phosphoheptose isomerase [Planctomycetes bacterium RBG_13_63_9]
MLGVDLRFGDYLDRLRDELARVDQDRVGELADLIYRAWENEKSVFFFGNGGSATASSHLAEDLAKNCLTQQAVDCRSEEHHRRLKVLSLTDNVGWITALANDYSYDQIFVQQLMHYAQPGDLAVAISGSGNSPNVLVAVDWANRHGLTTFGLTGFDGGRLKQMQKTGLHVALDDMAMVESIHLAVCHWVVDDLHGRITKSGRYGP